MDFISVTRCTQVFGLGLRAYITEIWTVGRGASSMSYSYPYPNSLLFLFIMNDIGSKFVSKNFGHWCKLQHWLKICNPWSVRHATDVVHAAGVSPRCLPSLIHRYAQLTFLIQRPVSSRFPVSWHSFDLRGLPYMTSAKKYPVSRSTPNLRANSVLSFPGPVNMTLLGIVKTVIQTKCHINRLFSL